MHSPMLANYRNVNAVVWRVSTSSYRNDKRYDLQPNVLQCLSNSEQSLYSRKKINTCYIPSRYNGYMLNKGCQQVNLRMDR